MVKQLVREVGPDVGNNVFELHAAPDNLLVEHELEAFWQLAVVQGDGEDRDAVAIRVHQLPIHHLALERILGSEEEQERAPAYLGGEPVGPITRECEPLVEPQPAADGLKKLKPRLDAMSVRMRIRHKCVGLAAVV